MAKPDCINCVHVRSNRGSELKSCANPKTGPHLDDPNRTRQEIIEAMGGLLNIEGERDAIRKGLFEWPWSYDPEWIVNCDGFEQKERG